MTKLFWIYYGEIRRTTPNLTHSKWMKHNININFYHLRSNPTLGNYFPHSHPAPGFTPARCIILYAILSGLSEGPTSPTIFLILNSSRSIWTNHASLSIRHRDILIVNEAFWQEFLSRNLCTPDSTTREFVVFTFLSGRTSSFYFSWKREATQLTFHTQILLASTSLCKQCGACCQFPPAFQVRGSKLILKKSETFLSVWQDQNQPIWHARTNLAAHWPLLSL